MPRLSKIGAACLAAFGYTQGTSTIAANYLVVAGGGGGGEAYGGGGGAGGLINGIASLNFTQTYVVTVGAGGNGSATTTIRGSQGSDSIISGASFSTVTATGGGGGGSSPDVSNTNAIGGNGGSAGGGAANALGGTTTTAGGTGTSGQGNNGGSGITDSTTYRAAGGGGGSSASGGNGTTTATGSGGNGTSSSISGTSVTYAGGGGGGAFATTRGAGGTGGGGAGGISTTTAPVAGTANTGGGGGGGAAAATFDGAAGGSGVVIISYTSPTQLFGGGIVTFVGGNWIHTFTTSGTLVPASTFTANYLVIAGGGGGGNGINANNNAGGGGAGGYRTSAGTSGGGGAAETALTLDVNSNYIVTVGAGGAASTNGSSSSFLSISTVGGGDGGDVTLNGGNGGSGGGGGAGVSPTSGGTGTANQGYAGGIGYGVAPAYGTGGGGGAGSVGGNSSSTTTGSGGSGVASTISGSSVTRAGGGGGGTNLNTPSTGGSGGGGNGGYSNGSTYTSPTAGTANTGGGGGGGIASATPSGGAGGSGVVIISYAGAQRMAGGTVTFVGGNTIHTFTSSGYLSALKLVNNSLRFKASTSSYLNRTPTTAGNRKTWTWSAWVKRGTLGAYATLFSSATAGANTDLSAFRFTNTDTLQFFAANATNSAVTTTVFRDPSAWYHIVVVLNTTGVANGFTLYVNGVQQTLTYTSFTSDLQPSVNNTVPHNVGAQLDSGSGRLFYFDGYMTEINFVDGQALTPSSFGGFNSYGVWQPCQYLGSFGTNGYYLPFTNNASSTTIGYDFSPNQNNWTANGFTLTPTTSVLYDSMTDVPTLTSATASNFAVMNPLDNSTTLSNANLTVTGAANVGVTGTIALPSTGSFYWEVTATTVVAGGNTIVGMIAINQASTVRDGTVAGIRVIARSDGLIIIGSTTVQSGLGSWASGDVIGCAYNATTNSLQFYKNNVAFGTAVNPTTGYIYVPSCSSVVSGTSVFNWNFGQRPFVGTVPTGFVALNTFNM